MLKIYNLIEPKTSIKKKIVFKFMKKKIKI